MREHLYLPCHPLSVSLFALLVLSIEGAKSALMAQRHITSLHLSSLSFSSSVFHYDDAHSHSLFSFAQVCSAWKANLPGQSGSSLSLSPNTLQQSQVVPCSVISSVAVITFACFVVVKTCLLLLMMVFMLLWPSAVVYHRLASLSLLNFTSFSSWTAHLEQFPSAARRQQNYSN